MRRILSIVLLAACSSSARTPSARPAAPVIANSYVGERDAGGKFKDLSRLRPLDVLELAL